MYTVGMKFRTNKQNLDYDTFAQIFSIQPKLFQKLVSILIQWIPARKLSCIQITTHYDSFPKKMPQDVWYRRNEIFKILILRLNTCFLEPHLRNLKWQCSFFIHNVFLCTFWYLDIPHYSIKFNREFYVRLWNDKCVIHL